MKSHNIASPSRLNGLLQLDLKSQLFLRQFNCSYNKIASAMIVYEELLHLVAEERKIHLFQQV